MRTKEIIQKNLTLIGLAVAVLFSPIEMNAQTTATPEAGDGKTSPEATAPAPSANQAPSANSQEEDKTLDQLEEDFNQLKGEVFRSKSRTNFLGEFLGSTNIEIRFDNRVKKDFELVSVSYALDNTEIFNKELGKGGTLEADESGRRDVLIFSGPTTPGRHEVSVVLVYRGKKSGGYTESDYEHQVREDFSFVAPKGEVSVVTITSRDQGYISDNLTRSPSHYKLLLDFRIEAKRLADARSELSRRRFAVQVESGMLFETYQIVSDRLNIDSQTDSLIPFGVRGNWWIQENFGLEGYYYASWWSAGTGGANDVDLSMNWLGLDGKFRYRFGRSILNPVLGLRVGYNILDLGVSGNQFPVTVRMSDQYKYVDTGIDFTIPVLLNFGFEGTFAYFPWIDIDESPMTSGSSSKTFGFEGRAGIYYNFWRGMSLTAAYKLLYLKNEFVGRGTRTSLSGFQLELVETQDVFHGGLIGLRYEF